MKNIQGLRRPTSLDLYESSEFMSNCLVLVFVIFIKFQIFEFEKNILSYFVVVYISTSKWEKMMRYDLKI